MPDADIASLAGLLADPTRAAFLLALSDGRARSAGELARQAGVSASTGSEQLARLLGGRLVTVEADGRHRYYRLADPRIVGVMEAMAAMAPSRPARSLSQVDRGHAIRFARSCYDHLAGGLGVGVADALAERAILVHEPDTYRVTDDGRVWLSALGIDADALRSKRRAYARPCLDWTERRHHIAGALGAALLDAVLTRRWLTRHKDSRALQLTPEGRNQFTELLGMDLEPAA